MVSQHEYEYKYKALKYKAKLRLQEQEGGWGISKKAVESTKQIATATNKAISNTTQQMSKSFKANITERAKVVEFLKKYSENNVEAKMNKYEALVTASKDRDKALESLNSTKEKALKSIAAEKEATLTNITNKKKRDIAALDKSTEDSKKSSTTEASGIETKVWGFFKKRKTPDETAAEAIKRQLEAELSSLLTELEQLTAEAKQKIISDADSASAAAIEATQKKTEDILSTYEKQKTEAIEKARLALVDAEGITQSFQEALAPLKSIGIDSFDSAALLAQGKSKIVSYLSQPAINVPQ